MEDKYQRMSITIPETIDCFAEDLVAAVHVLNWMAPVNEPPMTIAMINVARGIAAMMQNTWRSAGQTDEEIHARWHALSQQALERAERYAVVHPTQQEAGEYVMQINDALDANPDYPYTIVDQ
jgi:Trm5-related predicted tRNA methylase